jgi:hypothetical protein
MATIRLSVSPGKPLESVVEAVGAATVSGSIELTYDQATTVVNDANIVGGTRAQTTLEIIDGLNKLVQYLLRQSDVAQP